MGKTKRFGIFLLLLVFIACGKSYNQRAAAKFQLAVSCCEKGDTVAALLQLDSVPLLFPKAHVSIEKAKGLSNKLNTELLYRKQAQYNNTINQVEQLEKMFDKEKTEFDRYALYVHKMQKFDRRWNQSFVQVHLNENGDLHISSNYYGQEWLNHTKIRVYDGDLQASTDAVPLDGPNNHHSDFMGLHWEKVSYKNGKDNGVIKFIAEHADRNLKTVFLGSRMSYIVLETFDKQAAKDALALSNALKMKVSLQKEIKEIQSRLN